jgi:hypothetical protein
MKVRPSVDVPVISFLPDVAQLCPLNSCQKSIRSLLSNTLLIHDRVGAVAAGRRGERLWRARRPPYRWTRE